MTRKYIQSVLFLFVLFFALHTVGIKSILAQTPSPTPANAPLSCALDPRLGSCPAGVNDIFTSSKYYKGEKCVTTYAEFITNPLVNHYWALDEEITSQGKADERARQFLYWAISKSAIDQHRSIRQIWTFTQNVTLFLFLFIVALFGIGYIIGQRTNFQLKIQIWPTIMKIITGLLFIVFSYAITMSVIQVSEILMKFFIESLGGDRLFNIYFSAPTSKEDSYATFIGCRDLNFKVQEAIRAEIMMLKLTNITYYVMGVMIILRKVLLWFLIFVSPFLSLLMPFILIRNTGWIWIGVFFQWVFYGPLFALFLGALNVLWTGGIPFLFDFSRVNSIAGYIYPTGINIVYGGPAQRNAQIINFFNNGNYVDTYAEYIVSLIMLWAVTFFPWWLLRIFRDYCCDGIMAMKNILLSMYDNMNGSPGPKPPSGPTIPAPAYTNKAMKLPKETEKISRIKLETIEEVRRTKTEDITRSLNLSMNKLTDVARFETNKQTNETIRKNLDFLAQPTKAETPAERQKFMNIRTELYSRTIKNDTVARQIVSSISASRFEQSTRKEELLRTIPQVIPASQVTQITSAQTTVQPQLSYATQTANVTNNTFASVHQHTANTITNNSSLLNTLSQTTQAPVQQIQSVLNSYKTNIMQAPSQVISSVVKETGIAKEKVTSIVNTFNSVVEKSSFEKKSVTMDSLTNNTSMLQTIAQTTQAPVQQIQSVLNSYKTNLTRAPSALPDQIFSFVAKDTNIAKEKVMSIINTVNSFIEKSNAQTKNTMTVAAVDTVTNNTSMLQTIAQTTQAPVQQIQSVLNSYKTNIMQAPSQVISSVVKETGIAKEKVTSIIKLISQSVIKNKEVVKQIAQRTNLNENVVEQALSTDILPQVPQKAPEKSVEQTISIPPSVSIEDYEEVKKMWTQQYEKGEVPVSENLTSREQWVDQDIVFITNTLNKLLSTDEQLRQEGVDDLAYILPIFLINNLKGEELVVYLKAKVEAAKSVKHDMEKEREITERLKKKVEEQEELVEVEKPKHEQEAKHLQMEEELQLPEDEKNNEKKIEEKTQDPKQSQTTTQQAPLENESKPQETQTS